MTDYIDSGPGAYGPSIYKTNCKNGKYVNKCVQNQVKNHFDTGGPRIARNFVQKNLRAIRNRTI